MCTLWIRHLRLHANLSCFHREQRLMKNKWRTSGVQAENKWRTTEEQVVTPPKYVVAERFTPHISVTPLAITRGLNSAFDLYDLLGCFMDDLWTSELAILSLSPADRDVEAGNPPSRAGRPLLSSRFFRPEETTEQVSAAGYKLQLLSDYNCWKDYADIDEINDLSEKR
ncbi:hypothetical protein Tco_0443026 [Tanacetum coccineum]